MTNYTRTRFKRGEIWIARVAYFEELAQSKLRPVVVVSDMTTADQEITPIVAPITRRRPRNDLDIPIRNWKESGLVAPSTVRVSKLIALHRNYIEFKIGTMHEADLRKILQTCRSLFDVRFSEESGK